MYVYAGRCWSCKHEKADMGQRHLHFAIKHVLSSACSIIADWLKADHSWTLIGSDFFYWKSISSQQYGSRQAKSVFHAQNMRIHIILRMRKISSGSLLSIDTFYSIQWFWKRTAKVLIRLHGCAGWSGPSLSTYAQRHVIARRVPIIAVRIFPDDATLWILKKKKYVSEKSQVMS